MLLPKMPQSRPWGIDVPRKFHRRHAVVAATRTSEAVTEESITVEDDGLEARAEEKRSGLVIAVLGTWTMESD